MRRLITAVIALAVMLSALPLETFAAELIYYSIEVEGMRDFDKAREMYEYVNELRESVGQPPLALDHELTECAMKRALETTVYYSHTRPDGSSCYTICSKLNGENIAAGRADTLATFEQWKNSDGHYNNMISENYRSIGIGCVFHNGRYYWVESFSIAATNGMETAKGTSELKHTVPVAEEKVSMDLYVGNFLYSGMDYPLDLGSDITLTAERVNPKFVYYSSSIAPSSFVWKSSDESVVKVSSGGVVTAVGAGTAVVSATIAEIGFTMKQSFSVSADLSKAKITAIEDQEYTGSPITPEPVVNLGSATLVKGKDYTVSYSNNTRIGTATVKIKGKGNYEGEAEASFNIVAADISGQITAKIDTEALQGLQSTDDFLKKCITLYKGEEKFEYGVDYKVDAFTVDDNGRLKSFRVSYIGEGVSGTEEFSSISTAKIEQDGRQYYTGEQVIPAIKITKDGKTLTEGVDYSVTPVKDGGTQNAKAVIKGLKNLFGSTTVSFALVKAEKGDLDRSGVVNMKDYTLLQRYLVLDDAGCDLYAADLDSNGKINMKDYARLQMKLNGIIL